MVFFCVSLLWIFFKLPDFGHALGYLTGMFTPSTNPNPPKIFYNLALLYSLPVIIQHFGFGSLFEKRLRRVEPLSVRCDGRAGLSGGRARNFLHLFSVLSEA